MTKKQAYRKPEIKKVKLAPQEAVLSFCKNVGANFRSGRCQGDPACTNRNTGS